MPKIDAQRSATAQLATQASKAGHITSAQLKGLTDGTISQADLDVAKTVVTKARQELTQLKADGAPQRKLAKAEAKVALAAALNDAVKAQQAAQEAPGGVSRPSTGSGKGSTVTRPASGSGKGSSVTPKPSTVTRPATGSGKGSSVTPKPSTVTRPSTGSGKGSSVAPKPATVTRPSTGSGKGSSVTPKPATVTRPSTGTGKGHR